MQKLIKRTLLYITIILLIEIVIIALLFSLFDNNIITNSNIVIYTSMGLAIFNLILLVIGVEIFIDGRNKINMTTSSLLGNEMEEVYNFGKVGLAIVDESYDVIWTNAFFNTIDNNIISKKITTLDSYIDNLIKNVEKEIELRINDRDYKIEFIQEARLFVFKDITRQEEYRNWANNKRIIIGFVQIDNYQDLSASIDEVSASDTLLKLQKQIGDYAKENHLLLTKTKQDTYLIMGYKEDYNQIVAGQMKILKNIEEAKQQYTLSIGIALGVDSFEQLYDMAGQALLIAESRGGDQTVINEFGKSLKFIGGRNETKESKNLVQVRVYSSTLISLIKQASSIFIMGHENADLDAIGASLGMYTFVHAINDNVKVVYGDDHIENQTKQAFKSVYNRDEIKNITLEPEDVVRVLDENSLLILVDVHEGERTICPELCSKIQNIALFDHHRRGANCIEHPVLSYIEPGASSASEMITEMIQLAPNKITIDSKVATMLLAGILLDTSSYYNHTTSRTYMASGYLKDCGADLNKAHNFLKIEYEDYMYRVKTLSTATMPVTGVMVALADENDFVDQSTLSRVSVEAMNIQGVRACFTIGRLGEKEVSISSRSDGSINCQLIMEHLGGGGTFTAAAALFKDDTYAPINEVKDHLIEVLNNYIDEAQGKGE